VRTDQGAHILPKDNVKGLAVVVLKRALICYRKLMLRENVNFIQDKAKNHPGLYVITLFVSDEELHWLRTDLAL